MNARDILGPVLIGIDGTELDDNNRRQLLHPAVGGVVLFARNIQSRSQIKGLAQDIRKLRNPRLLVCIDQEGGRVQRLQEGFTRLPPLGILGDIFQSEPDHAVDLAYRHARVMAAEILACKIDVSFAPVLDLNRGSSVIGDRSFSASKKMVIELGSAYLAGMHDAGMKTTGKHYPGHGSVVADSHTHDVVDNRSLTELQKTDLVPFERLAGHLDALMIAHVVYPSVDELPAGYSKKWLMDYLKRTTAYEGVILSDDLGMHAALIAGDVTVRTRLCLEAGCDLVLVCQPSDVAELLDGYTEPFADASDHIASMYGTERLSHDEMLAAESQGAGEWCQWQDSLVRLNSVPGNMNTGTLTNFKE
jgi:beta-N-acetylhexosaminidase